MFHIHFLKIVELIFDFVYDFESARIKCVYAIPHMKDYPLFVNYYQLRSQICLSMHVERKLTQTNQYMWQFFINTFCVVTQTSTC